MTGTERVVIREDRREEEEEEEVRQAVVPYEHGRKGSRALQVLSVGSTRMGLCRKRPKIA
jgi:hypothetical protein